MNFLFKQQKKGFNFLVHFLHFLIEDLKSLSCYKLKYTWRVIPDYFCCFLIRGNQFVVKEPTYMQPFHFVKLFMPFCLFFCFFFRAACTYLALRMTLAGHGWTYSPSSHRHDWNIEQLLLLPQIQNN
ncbi:hypothetical protein GDO78_010959 [Eleutherodactylus coqui]|uniref:Uncharacterized protein n=1 Tax=Eleutherodactylus coqui TaxID=57060 RepID=A0A8J6F5P3_ELECQ|nr:hypothetical protein GDO78_010959 [Eleutherodactylus coqui]